MSFRTETIRRRIHRQAGQLLLAVDAYELETAEADALLLVKIVRELRSAPKPNRPQAPGNP